MKNNLTFDQIYNQYYEECLSYLVMKTKNIEEAKDITQDLFFSFLKREKDLLEVKDISKYIHRAMKFSYLDFVRKGKSIQTYKDSLTKNDGAVEQPEYTEDIKKLFIVFIDNLPERQRQSLIFTKIFGMNHIEAAKTVGITNRTLENHATIVNRKIKKFIESL